MFRPINDFGLNDLLNLNYKDNLNYLTLGSCLKSEESYIMDFIIYHRYVGIQKFVFLDREYNILSKLLANELDVEIIHFPEGPNNTHQDAWAKLINYNKNKTKWLALIDADQCLVPAKTNNVCDILKDYEEFASLQLNWRAFGSSFHDKRGQGSVYERFLLTAEDDSEYNYPTQFICQPDKTLDLKPFEPHYPRLPDGEISVNTNKEQISNKKIVKMNPATPLSFNVPSLHNTLYVNHYTNKSKEEWLIKNSKGRADIFGAKIPTEQFDEYESHCNKKIDNRAFELWEEAIK